MSLLLLMKECQEYNSILTVVCWIIKYILFISTWDDTTAADDLVFLENVNLILSVKSMFFDFSSCFDSSRILELIKNIQELDLQYRWISNQLCKKSEKSFLFALITENSVLKKTYCVLNKTADCFLMKMNQIFVSLQKTLRSQLLQLYHDFLSEDYWDNSS